MSSAGNRQRDQQAGGQRGRQQRAPQHPVDDARPEAERGDAGLEPVEARDAALVDAVAQPREQRGKHRQRPDHRRRRRPAIVPVAHEVNVGAPAKYMPAMAVMTVMPETSTARPEVAAAASIAASLLRPGGPLLAHAAQVEQRVVDAHGQADQQDDVVDRLLDRGDLAERADEAHRREHAGDRQQQRDAGREQRAEREQQDDQRQRQRGDLGLLQVALEDLLERLLGAPVAELLDVERGVARSARPWSPRPSRRSTCRPRGP